MNTLTLPELDLQVRELLLDISKNPPLELRTDTDDFARFVAVMEDEDA